MARFLIVSGEFYKDIAAELLKGATDALLQADHQAEMVNVPGALEIPQAIVYGIESGHYDGFIALGTVIRGETAHYDVVAGESARALMDLSMRYHAPIGNGILTVENHDQALERASTDKKNKGADAANAAVKLFHLKAKFND